MITLATLIATLTFILLMGWAISGRLTKPKPIPVQASKPQPIAPAKPKPVRPDEGRGAYAILNEARRAKALALPGQSAPKDVSFHVVRLANRELAVMHRTRNEPATDHIMSRFRHNDGIGAWRERNRLQYGRAS